MTLYFAPLGTGMPSQEWTEIGTTTEGFGFEYESEELIESFERLTDRTMTIEFEITDAMREWLDYANAMFDVLGDEDWDSELVGLMNDLEEFPPPGYEPLDLEAMCVWGSVMGRKLA